MIDRKARNKLAEEIRHFVECFTDNFEFDDAMFELKTKDRGVNAIYDQMWLTYDDLQRHKLEGKWALNENQLVIIKRAIVFLKSDFEYRWPKWPLYYKALRPIIWLLSLGKATNHLDEHFNGSGNLEAWPFFTSEEYENALQKPRYMANCKRPTPPSKKFSPPLLSSLFFHEESTWHYRTNKNITSKPGKPAD